MADGSGNIFRSYHTGISATSENFFTAREKDPAEIEKLEKLKNDIYLWLFFAIPAQENRTDDAESRLINHLMKNYDMKRQILPTNNRSKAVVVTFDMAFSLLVDLVSRVGLLTQSRYD